MRPKREYKPAPEDGFTMFPNWLHEFKGVPGLAFTDRHKAVYLAMRSFMHEPKQGESPDLNKGCWASMKNIANRSGRSERQTREIVAELLVFGVIREIDFKQHGHATKLFVPKEWVDPCGNPPPLPAEILRQSCGNPPPLPAEILRQSTNAESESHEQEGVEPEPSVVLTLCEPHADDVRDELGTMLEEVPALRSATGKRRGEWVHKAARRLADVYSDEHSLGRYHKLFWAVVKGERDAAEILRAFDTVDADGESGKLRGEQGPYFFGVLETGYDGDRRLSEESEAQADVGLSRAPGGNWDDPHEPTDTERAAMRETRARKPTADERREKLLRQYEGLRAAEAAKTGG